MNPVEHSLERIHDYFRDAGFEEYVSVLEEQGVDDVTVYAKEIHTPTTPMLVNAPPMNRVSWRLGVEAADADRGTRLYTQRTGEPYTVDLDGNFLSEEDKTLSMETAETTTETMQYWETYLSDRGFSVECDLRDHPQGDIDPSDYTA